uniref:ATP-binding cassette domain-containing protein n=1 Tax=Ningiella ruwaisensis TaxID=2364274 RepID=UPI00240D49E5|nr:ATP-binding cassette domain-containing protein [Ningiella ruwaisensis]
MTTTVLSIKSMDYAFSKSSSPILSIPEWQLESGERVFLHGDSGSGKTTLLNLLCGILLPQKGSITVLDSNLTTMKQRDRDRFRAQNIGVVFQRFNLIPYLSVAKNIELAAYFAGKSQQLNNSTLIERAQSLCGSLKLPKDTFSSI